MLFLFAAGIWFAGTSALTYLGFNLYAAMIVTYVIMLAIAWDIEKTWDRLIRLIPDWTERSERPVFQPRQKPAVEPAPQTEARSSRFEDHSPQG